MTNIQHDVHTRQTPEIARPTRHAYTVVRHRRPSGGATTAVVSPPGRKWLHYVAIDDAPIRLHRVRLSELRYCTGLDYPTRRACRRMLDAGTRLGITKGARDFLTRALSADVLPGIVSDVHAKDPLEPPPLLGSESKCENRQCIGTGSVVSVDKRALCVRCKRSFEAERRSARYCSERCKKRAYRARGEVRRVQVGNVMSAWSWRPDAETRAAITRGERSHKEWQRRLSERVEAERRKGLPATSKPADSTASERSFKWVSWVQEALREATT